MKNRAEVKSHQQLLYAAIDDIGEAVRGNDAKAYAALVLHGLILAALTTLVTALGPVYQKASCLERTLGVGFLSVTFVCFLLSAWFLIDAVTPYRPEGIERLIRARYRHVFFPIDVYGYRDPHGEMTRRLTQMDEFRVRDELVAETLKLGKILSHESLNTGRGYRILRFELGAAAAFLIVVAVSAL